MFELWKKILNDRLDESIKNDVFSQSKILSQSFLREEFWSLLEAKFHTPWKIASRLKFMRPHLFHHHFIYSENSFGVQLQWNKFCDVHVCVCALCCVLFVWYKVVVFDWTGFEEYYDYYWNWCYYWITKLIPNNACVRVSEISISNEWKFIFVGNWSKGLPPVCRQIEIYYANKICFVHTYCVDI